MDDPYAEHRDDNLTVVLTDLADRQQMAEQELAQAEEQVKSAKKKLQSIVEHDIPAATDNLKGKFTLPDGRVMELGEKVRASISGARKGPAVEWLDNHGYNSILRKTSTVNFGVGDSEKHQDFLNLLSQSQHDFQVSNSIDVHHQTLEAFIREKLQEGVDLPQDVFGIYTQHTSRIKS